MITKKEFIQVFRYSYGATIKEAQKAYKETSENYKKELVNGYKQECKINFYQD